MSVLRVAIAMEDWDRVALVAMEAWEARGRGEVCVCTAPEVVGLLCADCGLMNPAAEARERDRLIEEFRRES